MATITKFEEIDAWKTARELTNQIYEISGIGDFSRDFGLRDQIRRSSVSIMSNIAEGFESQSQALFINFLGNAKASAGEVRSQLYIALDQDYITQDEFDTCFDLVDKASRQIYSFRRYLESQPNTRRITDGEIYYEINNSQTR